MKIIKLQLDEQYRSWLADIKTKVRQSQLKASLSVNSALLDFYWNLGRDIVEIQKSHTWGEGLFLQLSKDFAEEFPDMKGFSVSNLRYMRQWYLFYRQSIDIHQQAVGELAQQPASQITRIPWGHSISLFMSWLIFLSANMTIISYGSWTSIFRNGNSIGRN